MALGIDVEIPHQQWLDAVPHLETLAGEVIKETLKSALQGHLKDRTLEMSVSFVSDEEMRALNLEYRDQDRPTNVLSFSQLSRDMIDGAVDTAGDQPLLLGDVVVALGVTQSEAASQNKSMDHHLTHLLVHGTLHLLGYDHLKESDAEVMESSETEILNGLGIGNPYISTDEDRNV